MKIKNFFVVIPPKNKRIRFYRIRFSVIILVILFFLVGVAGYFIPFNRLTLDEVEINQKKHLTVQNAKIQTKVSSMTRTFHLIKGKIVKLEKTRIQLEKYIEIDKKIKKEDRLLKNTISEMSLDEIGIYIDATNEFYKSFAEILKENPQYTEFIPLIKPIEDSCLITVRFGKRKDPFTGILKQHNGIDFAAERETSIMAAASGTIEYVKKKDTHWGRHLKIKHKFGFSTFYAHLGTVIVSKGKKVKKGEKIATVGLSGLTTGPHLHFEIQRYNTPVDPERYFFPAIETIASIQNEKQ